MREAGLLIVALGVAVAVLGTLLAAGVFSWVGRLPGDIHFHSDGGRVFVPVTTMLLVSMAATVIAALLRRLL